MVRRAFTMTELILILTIVGIIAATIIKPNNDTAISNSNPQTTKTQGTQF